MQILKPLEPTADLNDIEGATIKMYRYLVSPALLHDDKKREALAAWLTLLARLHPIDRCRAGAGQAAAVLEHAWPSGEDHVTDPKALTEVQICGTSEFEDWKGCKGSIPDSRGYTCGLWQLFHSLSVRLPEGDVSGQEWLGVLKGYVEHFFQCMECAGHFLQYANSPDARLVLTKRDAALWLWRIHNEANVRIGAHEETSGDKDPKFPKVQWPEKDLCASCKTADGKWNDDAVYPFLFRYYLGLDAVVEGNRANAEHAAAAGKAVKRQSSWADALAMVALVFGTVYASLRASSQYAMKKSISRLL